MRDYCDFKKKHKAFTLIELMAVIAIIGIMSAVAFVSLNSTKSASRLKTAQREVTSIIKLAQTYALQGKNQEYPVGSGTFITPCGYGFRFKDTSDITNYEIFYNIAENNINQDCTYKNDPSRTNYKHWRNGNGPQSSQTNSSLSYSLKNGVTLSSPTINNLNNNDTEIYFTVPHAEMFGKNGGQYPLTQEFEFNYGGVGGTTKKITINRGGYVTESP